ncbi:sensor histidine kinase [Paractinoplanes brasiliensis]|uniref:histidine kinase n=1 Tax=Paractinoplanes brasiliensis TaxID=52695 RepID=A0A4R6JB31_9ACTN|nr:ATP-binding protein [Actinoplanes brasiliensis]TDO32889.1 sensor histidine kinase regulating citrate/malate metabolism [Actinoplanes brasiliensis]GID28605.1 ATPase [Actinoplanes brasiliensis]
MRHRLSFAGQLLLLQLAIVLLVVGAVAAVSIAEADATFRRVEGERLRSVGENTAINRTVRLGLDNPLGREALETVAESARAVSGASYVMVADAAGTIVTGPDAGRAAPLGDSTGLTGRSWVGVITDGGKSLAAHVPVLDEVTGAFIGLIIVGRAYPTLIDQLGTAVTDLLTYLVLGIALGAGGSLLLARRVKRQTLGLEPREIAGLVEHREAMLHGIKEGVIGTDSAHRVTLANDEAIRLLGMPPDVVGRSLEEQPLEPALLDVLTGRSVGVDQVVLSDDRVVVLNRQPVVMRDRTVGSVTTLRDRTELTALRRELDVSRHTTDTLRAQAHEFVNRLHTIAGLVELGEHDEVVRYITRASELHESLDREVTRVVRDTALAALLIAKASLASEQGVTLSIGEGTDLPPVDDRLSADLVTVVGNLVDNAFDALTPGGAISVTVRAEERDVVVTVTDSGPGVPPEMAERVFQQGYSTKDSRQGHHGLGLAMIRLICVHRGGGVSVSGSTFTARLGLS